MAYFAQIILHLLLVLISNKNQNKTKVNNIYSKKYNKNNKIIKKVFQTDQVFLIEMKIINHISLIKKINTMILKKLILINFKIKIIKKF